jgi:hypothetical protein
MNRLGDEDGTAICRGLGDIRVEEQTCLVGINSAVLARKPNGPNSLSSCAASYAFTRRPDAGEFLPWRGCFVIYPHTLNHAVDDPIRAGVIGI